MRAFYYYTALVLAAVPACEAWPYGRTIPPLPAAWHSTVAADMTTAYFVGNATGLDSAAELAAEARWGIIGIGWQLNGSWVPRGPQKGNHFGRHVEVAERETAAALKSLNPKLKVLLGRNTEVATCYLDSVAAIWNRTDVWLKCPNKTNPAAPVSDCVSGWGSWGQKKFFDFSQPALRAWYVLVQYEHPFSLTSARFPPSHPIIPSPFFIFNSGSSRYRPLWWTSSLRSNIVSSVCGCGKMNRLANTDPV